jgi:pyruvate/2-oxoglutarate dehydrogenase complex dihydrolipoamide dehydrogenase (E3) component
MTAEKYTNIIIGRGEGGKYLAWHLAQSGQRTIVIERRWIGGSCPNVNCLPSKNEIWSRVFASTDRSLMWSSETPAPMWYAFLGRDCT